MKDRYLCYSENDWGTKGELCDTFRGGLSTHLSRLDIFSIRDKIREDTGCVNHWQTKYQACVLHRQTNHKSHSFEHLKTLSYLKNKIQFVIQLFLLQLYFGGWSSIDFCELNTHPSCIINVNLSQTARRKRRTEVLPMPVSGMANSVFSVATRNRPCTERPTPCREREHNIQRGIISQDQ